MSTDANEMHAPIKNSNAESKQQHNKGQELVVARYGALVGLWSHHNTTLLQWPPVIISASLIVISLVTHVPGITHPNSWGIDSEVIVGAGIPLLLTGLAMTGMLYTMERARKVSRGLEEALVSIEEEFEVKKDFRNLNHPPGLSGVMVIWIYMALFLALPITLAGFLLTLGPLLGSFTGGLLILAWLIVEFWQRRIEKANLVRVEVTKRRSAEAQLLEEASMPDGSIRSSQ